jgi:transcriptional regulator with XRE-family HTH domain
MAKDYEPRAMALHHRRIIADLVRKQGIRNTARAAGVTPMLVSRFCNGSGGDDAATLYILADAVGHRLELRR